MTECNKTSWTEVMDYLKLNNRDRSAAVCDRNGTDWSGVMKYLKEKKYKDELWFMVEG